MCMDNQKTSSRDIQQGTSILHTSMVTYRAVNEPNQIELRVFKFGSLKNYQTPTQPLIRVKNLI